MKSHLTLSLGADEIAEVSPCGINVLAHPTPRDQHRHVEVIDAGYGR